MARGQTTQTDNGENRVDVSYEEVSAIENRHHDIRPHSDDEESGQLPSYSTGP